jgi:hypothetical protein
LPGGRAQATKQIIGRLNVNKFNLCNVIDHLLTFFSSFGYEEMKILKEKKNIKYHISFAPPQQKYSFFRNFVNTKISGLDCLVKG